MKSFLIACLLFSIVIGFVCWHTHHTAGILKEMDTLSQLLPQNEEDFVGNYEAVGKHVDMLYDLWDQHFSYIAFTVGYENTNRCDESLGDLQAYFRTGNPDEFIAANARFRDALSRLRMLESFHPESIF